MSGWLEEVQRDPRTLGAFRRRIETLLTDPAVARRIAGRIGQRDCGRPAAPARRTAPDGREGVPALLSGALSGHCAGADRRAAVRPGDAAAAIFGRCDCPSGCCLMVPDLRRFPAHVAPALPVTAIQRH